MQDAPFPYKPAIAVSAPAQAPAPVPKSLPQPVSEHCIGTLRSINGTRAQIIMDGTAAHAATLGAFVTIRTGYAIAIAQIVGMHVPESMSSRPGVAIAGVADIELVGELLPDADGNPTVFRRGVSVAPRLGDQIHMISHDGLSLINRQDNSTAITVGKIHQDPTVPAAVEIDEMLGKHFAIVGSTGTGKSCTVALLLRRVLERHPHAHIVLLDPHNEYASCFGQQAEHVPLHKLNLPYWCLTFEEVVEVLLGSKAESAEEVEVLRELIPAAKRQFALAGADEHASIRLSSAKSRLGRERFSVDVPLPYRMADLIAMIDEEMGKLEKQRDLNVYRRLKARIATVTQDPRFGFMFGSFAVQDSLKSMLQQLFRVPVAGKPITVIGLMGLPSEVINVLVSVLARLAFDLAIYSEGRLPITFVCEEAHRYVPAQSNQGFEPTKRSIARIAKEGRKYGASLCVVSQRPADLDPTILSQCSTVFAMRLANERDQTIIGSALADASHVLLNALPMLGTREAIVFGEAVNLPSRIVLDQLPSDALPRGNTAAFTEHWAHDQADDEILTGVIQQWRYTSDGLKERMSSAMDRLKQNRDEEVTSAQRSDRFVSGINPTQGVPASPAYGAAHSSPAAAPSGNAWTVRQARTGTGR